VPGKPSLTIEEILALLTQTPQSLSALSADLTPAQLRISPDPESGEWSANDVLAHLRSWRTVEAQAGSFDRAFCGAWSARCEEERAVGRCGAPAPAWLAASGPFLADQRCLARATEVGEDNQCIAWWNRLGWRNNGNGNADGECDRQDGASKHGASKSKIWSTVD
jgi:hypothetical protein